MCLEDFDQMPDIVSVVETEVKGITPENKEPSVFRPWYVELSKPSQESTGFDFFQCSL